MNKTVSTPGESAFADPIETQIILLVTIIGSLVLLILLLLGLIIHCENKRILVKRPSLKIMPKDQAGCRDRRTGRSTTNTAVRTTEVKTGIHIFIDHSNIRVSGEYLCKRELKIKNKKLRKGLIPRVRIDIPRIVEVITDGRKVLSRSVAGSFNAPKKFKKTDRIRYKGEQQIYQDLNFDILVSVQRGQKETSVDGAIAKAIQRCASQKPGCIIIVASGDKSSNHGEISIQESIQQARKNGAYVETWGWEHQKCDKSLNGKGCAHIIGKLPANIGKVNL